MPKPAPMTLLDATKTIRHGNRRGTREIVEATSADGDWAYIRVEDAGTPWDIHHLATGRVLRAAAPTLAVARKWTASGGALAELDRRDVAARETAGVAA